MNAVLGTDLDAEDVWDSLAPLGIELDADPADGADEDAMVGAGPDLPARPRPRDRPGGGGGPPHRLRPHRPDPARHPRPGRHAHRPPAGASAGRRRTRRRRALRGDHPVAGRAEPTSSAPVRRSTAWCAPPTRCGRRSRCCAPRCCRGCCARWPATGPRASATSRCSRWAGCSSPRSAPRRPTLRSPTSPSTSPWRWRAPWSAARWRTTDRSTCTTRSTPSPRSSMRWGSTT